MIDTALIDGKAAAARLRASFAQQIGQFDPAARPGLAVVLVGDDPASHIYVRNKARQTVEAGMRSFERKLSAETPEAALLDVIAELNADDRVHGVLVQLPLPGHIDASRVLAAIDPAKDVDGFHVVNVGRLCAGVDGLAPCTPLGCVLLLKETLGDLAGAKAVIVGRSNIVGKPLSQLLLRENCTVTIAHSKSLRLDEECRQADILVAAVGRPEFIRGAWIKPGATVIDVGINRLNDGRRASLVGDVAFQEAIGRAAHITPVPGGVGPMTIACLLANTWKAFNAAKAT